MTNSAISGPLVKAAAPVRDVTDVVDPAGPTPGIALCLSGGGYRAMVFHLGALWRLNEAGFLPRLDHISSVSGGSMTAGILARHWSKMKFGSTGVAENFLSEVVAPTRALASRTIDVWAVLFSWLGFSVTNQLQQQCFGNATLQDLPERPRFLFNTTNVQSSALWRFSKPFAWDYRVGKIPNPRIPLASVVAASAAFPPVLSPVILRFKASDFTPGTGDDLQYPPFTTKAVLTDGGVYDNLGLETAWKRYLTVLVSDGGRRVQPAERPSINWLGHTARVVNLIYNQVVSVRKRQLIASYEALEGANHRSGTYWGVGSDIRKYPVAGALPCPEAATLRLADTPTRLQAMAPLLQERLINWGYAICDAALRSHVDFTLTAPANFPYPAAGVG